MKYHTTHVARIVLPIIGILLFSSFDITGHPLDYGAVPLDTLVVSVEIDQTVNPKAQGEVVLWLTSDSTLDILIDIESIVFSGDCSGIDSISLHQVCAVLSDSAINTILESAHGPLALNGNVRVLTQGWGERIGSDVYTTFLACSHIDFAIRSYFCSYTGGGWTFDMVFADVGECSTCAGGCEPSYAGSIVY